MGKRVGQDAKKACLHSNLPPSIFQSRITTRLRHNYGRLVSAFYFPDAFFAVIVKSEERLNQPAFNINTQYLAVAEQDLADTTAPIIEVFVRCIDLAAQDAFAK